MRSMTVDEILERVRERRDQLRCPGCDARVSIRGVGGEYRWTCLDCDAIGIGFASRSDAQDAVARRRRHG